MSIATVVYDLMEEGDAVPGHRFGEVTDNFLIVWVDEEGLLRRHHSGPGPWEHVMAAMGDRVDPGPTILHWTRPLPSLEGDDPEDGN